MKIWTRAKLLTQKEKAVISRIERYFSGYGLSVAIGRQTFTGEHRTEAMEAEPGEGIKKESILIIDIPIHYSRLAR